MNKVFTINTDESCGYCWNNVGKCIYGSDNYDDNCVRAVNASVIVDVVVVVVVVIAIVKIARLFVQICKVQ